MPNFLSIMSNRVLNLTEVHLHIDEDYIEPIIVQLNKKNSSGVNEYLHETGAFDPPKKSFKIVVRHSKPLGSCF